VKKQAQFTPGKRQGNGGFPSPGQQRKKKGDFRSRTSGKKKREAHLAKAPRSKKGQTRQKTKREKKNKRVPPKKIIEPSLGAKKRGEGVRGG